MKTLDRKAAGLSVDRPLRVVQFGTGNFLRGFADWMVDILNEKADFNGSIHLVQTKGQQVPESFVGQDYLYHVWLRGFAKGETIDQVRLISSISGISNPELDYSGFLDLAANPELKYVISNATEAGVYFDLNDADFARCPQSFPGKLTAFLYSRFLHVAGDTQKGLVILPCELIASNGTTLREIVLSYADLWQLTPKFLAWLEASCVFCNTLVDRIVPGYPKDGIVELESKTGFRDDWAVVAEPYHFWAIQGPEYLKDVFQTEKTGLEVHIVDDLTGFQTRKVRILNGAHTATVPVAYLAGKRSVREAVEDTLMGKTMQETVFHEIIPSMDLPKEELHAYAAAVFDRFRNPFIHHELISIALNSVSKFRVRVLPSILSYHEKTGSLPPNLICSFAALLFFYSGKTSQEPIPLKDDAAVLRFFAEIWQSGNLETIAEKALGKVDFWGQDLREIPGLQEALVPELEVLQG
jgi:tagaturonate reductase